MYGSYRSGITYEQRKDGKSSARRYYECKKCHDKVYTKEPNFQDFIVKESNKISSPVI